MGGYKFTVYFYDNRFACEPGIDTNELYIGDKFISEINRVKSVYDLREIKEDELEYIVLIVPCDTDLPIRNINPYPEEYF